MAGGEVTRLLLEAEAGGREALERVFPLLYQELRRLAHQQMARESPAHTLDATALLHEAYLKLLRQERVHWQGRDHVLAVASTVMRRVLVSHARERGRQKRGGSERPLPLTSDPGVPVVNDDLDLLALDQVLDRLEELDPRAAQVVECRVFGGLSVEDTAASLGVSTATIKRTWRFAKTWLRSELEEGP